MQPDEKRWEEKRKYKRAYVSFPVEYRGKSFWQVVQAQDISAGGMFVATEKVEPPRPRWRFCSVSAETMRVLSTPREW